jgi:hypothetical protein
MLMQLPFSRFSRGENLAEREHLKSSCSEETNRDWERISHKD